jgi:hypothetical protein
MDTLGQYPMNAPDCRGRGSNEVLRIKMRAGVLALLTLFVVSGIAASTSSAAGPYWHVNNAKLTAGAKQITLQNKGSAVLTSEIGTTSVVITCTASESEGATIEGNGNNQGQDKGRIKYTGCSINIPKCVVSEPITTKETKSHLVTFKGTQSKYADLYEPTEGTTFTTVTITKGTEACSVAAVLTVKGSVAAEVVPKETETQEGLVNFPETAITPVFLEGAEKAAGLKLGEKVAKFKAAYKAKLATGETFGVFGS